MVSKRQPLCGIIPAAGDSRRYGPENKLFARVNGVALLEHVVRAISRGGVEEVLVVSGPDHEPIVSLLSRYEVRVIQNPNWQCGMGTSIAYAAGQIAPGGFSGILVCPGDLPALTSDSVRTIIRAFTDHGGEKIVRPVCKTRRGHPVVFPASFLPALSSLKGDEGARSILRKEAESLVEIPVADAGIYADMDFKT